MVKRNMEVLIGILAGYLVLVGISMLQGFAL